MAKESPLSTSYVFTHSHSIGFSLITIHLACFVLSLLLLPTERPISPNCSFLYCIGKCQPGRASHQGPSGECAERRGHLRAEERESKAQGEGQRARRRVRGAAASRRDQRARPVARACERAAQGERAVARDARHSALRRGARAGEVARGRGPARHQGPADHSAHAQLGVQRVLAQSPGGRQLAQSEQSGERQRQRVHLIVVLRSVEKRHVVVVGVSRSASAPGGAAPSEDEGGRVGGRLQVNQFEDDAARHREAGRLQSDQAPGRRDPTPQRATRRAQREGADVSAAAERGATPLGQQRGRAQRVQDAAQAEGGRAAALRCRAQATGGLARGPLPGARLHRSDTELE